MTRMAFRWKKWFGRPWMYLAFLVAMVAGGTAVLAQPALYWGSQGDWVYALQQRLYNWGYYKGPVDGSFGNSTSHAVVDFQLNNGLIPDGIVGTTTWQNLALGIAQPAAAAAAAPAAPAVSANVSDQSNVNLLAHLIGGEAEDQPFEGKVGVAAVVLNRLRSAAFPHTIPGIVYQPYAFESVSNGIFNNSPTPSDIQAATSALSGWDPTGGAVFFWNPAKLVSPWIWTRTIITQIGQHVFAR
ncbi:MAG TPA: spore cortex-lytic enzyme [Spirochaetia bacterium]|nr:spore cortex-lytic enzyme [Spirochaetia bacterium]